MEERSQRLGEDTREYFFDKVRFCKDLGFEVSEIKKQIAIGLWSRETSVAVMSQEFSTLDDMLQRILDMESLEVARKHRIAGKREQSFEAVRREVLTSSSLSRVRRRDMLLKSALSQSFFRRGKLIW